MTVGAGPISPAAGEPPCAAQHGPHTTARVTVARGRPTRTRHVTHKSLGTGGPADDATPSPARSRAAASPAVPDRPTADDAASSEPTDHARGTAAKGDVSGALSPTGGVSSPGHTGPRRGSPGMVAPACSGRQKPTRRTRLFRAVADEDRG